MVEISLSGSGEGPGSGNRPAYSTTGFSTACCAHPVVHSPPPAAPLARQRGSGGLASVGRQAAGPADWGWEMGRRLKAEEGGGGTDTNATLEGD
jgi:hypothetical protein